MEITVKTGMILMKDGTLLPAGLDATSDVFSPGWRAFRSLNAYALSRKIEAENWQFFCVAGDVRGTAVGRDRQKTVTRAVKNILASHAMGKYNSLEVTEIAPKWFLGVPRLQVSARLRHIQEGILLVPPKDPPGKNSAHMKSPGRQALALAPAEEPVHAR